MITILVADQNELQRHELVNFLNGLDYHARGLNNDSEVWHYCTQIGIPNLIFFAATPSNLILCNKIRQTAWGKRIPLIITESLLHSVGVEDAFAIGADEFISKPFNWVAIRQKVLVLLERFHAERAQQDIELRFRAVFDTAVDGIILIDSDGIIHFANQAVQQMFNYSESDLIDKPINMLMPEPWASQHDSYIQKYLSTGIARIIGIGREVTCLHRDGHTFPMQLAVSQLPQTLDNKIWFTGILHDIGKRIAMENELRQQKDKMEDERRVIEGILTRMRRAPFDATGLRILNQPVETTSGDLALAAARPSGIKHIFLGDCTGHGLSAALVGPLVTDIFYTMTLKGFSPDQILREMNSKLHEKLPASIFLAGCFLELNFTQRYGFIWNGGFPEAKIIRNEKVITRIASHTLPLGILSTTSFDTNGVVLELTPGDNIVVFTDGIIETRSPTGELFGHERLEQLLREILNNADASLDIISQELAAFRAGAPQEDDITLLVSTVNS